jgi:GNAT superfamily N-acetyltransferase
MIFMIQNWKVRNYMDGDEVKIFELWEAIHPNKQYNLKDWMTWWNWMYKQNPAGNGIIFLADHNDKVVGQYAVIPMLMKMNKNIIMGSLGVDAMTHPNYRRQGIFQTLGKTTLSYAENKGIKLMIAKANDYSGPGSISKLNMFPISSLRLFFKPLNWENALRPRIKNKFLLKICVNVGKLSQHTIYRNRSKIPKDVNITKISSFDERINEFWNDISNYYLITIVRNREFLNWRYVSVPNRKYTIYIAEVGEKIEGYIVLRYITQQTRKIGTIFDIVVRPSRRDIIHLLISKAYEYFLKENVDLIEYHIFSDKIYRRALRDGGFIRFPQFFAKNIFCVYSKLPSDDTEFLKDKKNWFIQLGNSDFL